MSLLVGALGLLAACGAGDRQTPGPPAFVLEKPATASGDRQVGVAGKPLEQDFRARVTRDGQPAAGVTVYWSTVQSSLEPATGLTDADGISESRWTTKFLYTEQEAYAGLEPDQGPRVPGSVRPGRLKFTAIATPDPAAANTVLLVDEGGHRFEPSSVTIAAGDTVNFLSFRFTISGIYRYHCAVHGGPGGTGMAGTVTVRPLPATD